MPLTGRCGSHAPACAGSLVPLSPEWPSLIHVGLPLVCPFGLTHSSPSLVPAYTAVPPPTPIDVRVQLRAPLGAGPVQPLLRSPLIKFQCTSPAACSFELSV